MKIYNCGPWLKSLKQLSLNCMWGSENILNSPWPRGGVQSQLIGYLLKLVMYVSFLWHNLNKTLLGTACGIIYVYMYVSYQKRLKKSIYRLQAKF